MLRTNQNMQRGWDRKFQCKSLVLVISLMKFTVLISISEKTCLWFVFCWFVTLRRGVRRDTFDFLKCKVMQKKVKFVEHNGLKFLLFLFPSNFTRYFWDNNAQKVWKSKKYLMKTQLCENKNNNSYINYFTPLCTSIEQLANLCTH